MSDGYAILESGETFLIKEGHSYTTAFYQGAMVAEPNVSEVAMYNSEKPDGLYAYDVAIEAYRPDELKFRRIVLPKGVMEFELFGDVTVLEPIVLPKGIKSVRCINKTPLANLESFIGNKDVKIIILSDE